MLLQELDAEALVLSTQVLVEIYLRVVRHEIPDLNASFLACEGQRARQVLDHPLVKVALVDEYEALRRDQAEEYLVEEAELRECEEKDTCCEHDSVFDRLRLVLLPLARAALQ